MTGGNSGGTGGVGGGYGSSGTDGGISGCIDASVDCDATATIGRSGGILQGPGGFQIEVPPDALEVPTDITVSVKTGLTAPTGTQFIGPVYELGPSGTQFAIPVTLTLPVPTGTSSDGLFPFTAPDTGDSFLSLPIVGSGPRAPNGLKT
jgi:hypothetical protein